MQVASESAPQHNCFTHMWPERRAGECDVLRSARCARSYLPKDCPFAACPFAYQLGSAPGVRAHAHSPPSRTHDRIPAGASSPTSRHVTILLLISVFLPPPCGRACATKPRARSHSACPDTTWQTRARRRLRPGRPGARPRGCATPRHCRHVRRLSPRSHSSY
jgi:hypothetical protein